MAEMVTVMMANSTVHSTEGMEMALLMDYDNRSNANTTSTTARVGEFHFINH